MVAPGEGPLLGTLFKYPGAGILERPSPRRTSDLGYASSERSAPATNYPARGIHEEGPQRGPSTYLPADHALTS